MDESGGVSCFFWDIQGVGMFTLNVNGGFEQNFKDLKGRRLSTDWIDRYIHIYTVKVERQRDRETERQRQTERERERETEKIGRASCRERVSSPV